jgi:membrane protein DedA with SNARE-associated domain
LDGPLGSLISSVTVFFQSQPLLLVFFLSIVGNIIPFFPTPYLLIIVALVSDSTSPLHGIGVIPIASVAALGASLGKFASYGLGYGARKALRKQERFDSLRRLLGRSPFVLGVVFAASPFVDAAFIPMGIIKYSPPKALLALYTGKFLWILSVIYVARQSGRVISQYIGVDTYASLVSIGLLVSIAYVMTRVEWEKKLWRRELSLLRSFLRWLGHLFVEDKHEPQAPPKE